MIKRMPLERHGSGETPPKQSLTTHVVMMVAFLILVILAVIISTFVGTQTQAKDAMAINVAGRQRMLTQKLTKATLGYVVEVREQAEARQYAKLLVGTRSHLAGAIGKAKAAGQFQLTEHTLDFAPAAAAKKIADAFTQGTNLTFRQVSHKYRNPANKPDAYEAKVLAKMVGDPEAWQGRDLTEKVIEGEHATMRYMKPLFVVKSCLPCHSDSDKVSKLIKDSYPEDKSLGFSVGDVRGAISVSWPTRVKSIADYKTEVSGVRKLFTDSLAALQDGGTVTMGTQDCRLSGVDDPGIRREMDTLARMWAEFTPQIDVIFSEDGARHEQFNDSVSFILTKNQTLLSQANKVTNLIQTAASDQSGYITWLQYTLAVVTLLVSGAIIYFVRIKVAAPIGRTADMLKDISQGDGDLTARLEVRNNDEIGRLARHFNAFADRIQGVVRSIGGSAESLVTSAGEMNTVSNSLATSSDDMTTQASAAATGTEQASSNVNTVASGIEQASAHATTVASAAEEVTENLNTVGAAVEEMSSNMSTVATTSERMTGSVNTVASAIEEMSTSLSVVARNSAQSADVAQKAAKTAGNTSKRVGALGDSAQEIGKIVEMIQGIAAQTNLLALNATIEAASAGEAGKGFAVVANEVKELAKQTASATDEIRQQVESMQDNTCEAVTAISEIVTVIDEVNSIASTIAAAVDEQTTTTNEIARSIADAAQGARDVSLNIQEAAQGASEVSGNVQEAVRGVNEVSRNIAELALGTREISGAASEAATDMNDVAGSVTHVSSAAVESAKGACQTKVNAETLSEMAADLQRLVGHFQVGTARFDIAAVKTKYLTLRMHLEMAVEGHEKPEASCIDAAHQSEFGQWLDSPAGRTLPADPAFAVATGHHEALHAIASDVVGLMAQGKVADAEKRLDVFDSTRCDLFAALDDLYVGSPLQAIGQ